MGYYAWTGSLQLRIPPPTGRYFHTNDNGFAPPGHLLCGNSAPFALLVKTQSRRRLSPVIMVQLTCRLWNFSHFLLLFCIQCTNSALIFYVCCCGNSGNDSDTQKKRERGKNLLFPTSFVEEQLTKKIWPFILLINKGFTLFLKRFSRCIFCLPGKMVSIFIIGSLATPKSLLFPGRRWWLAIAGSRIGGRARQHEGDDEVAVDAEKTIQPDW